MKTENCFSRRTELTAIWLILLSGTLYGFLGFFGTQLIKEHLTIVTMLFWRFFVATLWMLIWSYWKNPKAIFQKTKNNLPALLMPSIFYAGSSFFYFYASREAGTGLAMVIFFSYPILVALMVWIKNSAEINLYSFLSIITLVLGLFLLQENKVAPLHFTSIIFALSASFSYALYIYQSKHIMHAHDANEFTISICFISALLFLIVSVSNHGFSFPPSLKSWGYLLGLGIIATAIPIHLLLGGLKTVSSLKAAILSTLEPAVTVVVGIIALHESLSYLQLIGVFVVLFSTVIIQFSRKE